MTKSWVLFCRVCPWHGEVCTAQGNYCPDCNQYVLGLAHFQNDELDLHGLVALVDQARRDLALKGF